jgi:hypothetical protein
MNDSKSSAKNGHRTRHNDSSFQYMSVHKYTELSCTVDGKNTDDKAQFDKRQALDRGKNKAQHQIAK